MSSASVSSPPQPCAAVVWFIAAVCLTAEAAIIWLLAAAPLIAGRTLDPLALGILGIATVGLAWVFARALEFGRVRLGDAGVWPNRKGYPEFVAWEGALVALRGYTVLIKNGPEVAEINMASFCRQKLLRDFINGKFPREDPASDK